jgi:ribulose kinase
MLGAVAAGVHADLQAAMAMMNSADRVIAPASTPVRDYHAQKHRVFLRMHDDQLAYRDLLG